MQTRRNFLILTLAMTAFACPGVMAGPARMSARQAHARAAGGDLLLLDIRSPAEWKLSGIGEGAEAVSMHEPGFMEKLKALTGGDTSKPVALICATGWRSTRVQQALTSAGYSQVINVAEGMLGGPNGPGWIKSGLPVRPYTP